MSYQKSKTKEWTGRNADQRTKERTQYIAAPSAGKGILKKYEELLRKATGGKKHFRACVLGATPETRDMVLKRGGELVTIDMNWDMILKCNTLMKYKDDPRDTIIKANWLDNPLKDNCFDVVLGDGVSNNIPFKKQNAFFRELARILKKGGYLILRENGVNPKRPRRTVEEIDKEFMDGKCHWFDVFVSLYFYSDLTPRVRDVRIHKYYFAKLFREIERAYRQKRMHKKTFDALWWFRGTLTHTFMPTPVLERFLKKYFRLLSVRQVNDYQFTQDSFRFFFGKKR